MDGSGCQKESKKICLLKEFTERKTSRPTQSCTSNTVLQRAEVYTSHHRRNITIMRADKDVNTQQLKPAQFLLVCVEISLCIIQFTYAAQRPFVERNKATVRAKRWHIHHSFCKYTVYVSCEWIRSYHY